MNSKKLLFFFLLLFSSLAVFAQEESENAEVEEERPNWRDKIFFGGGGGLQFSNVGTFVAVMPSVGYRITPKLSAGVIANYQFVRYRDFDVSAHNYGGSLFSRYFVFPQVFAAAEYEKMSMRIVRFGGESERRWVDRMLVGAGYFQSGGRRGGFYAAVMYDLFYTSSVNYPYHSPFVYRVGFTF